jgi:hypothetical protein
MRMVNLTRGKDALRALDEVHRFGQFYADAVGGGERRAALRRR